MSELRVIDPSSGQEVGRLPCSDAGRLVETARAVTPLQSREGGRALQGAGTPLTP